MLALKHHPDSQAVIQRNSRRSTEPMRHSECFIGSVELLERSSRKTAHFFDWQKVQNGAGQRAKKREPGQKNIPGGESEDRCSEGGMARCMVYSQH